MKTEQREALDAQTAARRMRHEWACRYAAVGCETLRRGNGVWEVLRDGVWRALDPATNIGEPVK